MSSSETIPSDVLAQAGLLGQTFRDCRSYVLTHAGEDVSTDKYDGSPQTASDIEVERIVSEKFRLAFPGVPILGEEAGYDTELPQMCWLLDPIDGTKSFLKNTPGFTNMAVCIRDNQALASVIYDPTDDVMYSAYKGSGAYRDGQPLTLVDKPLPNRFICKNSLVKPLNELFSGTGVSADEINPEGAGNTFALVAKGLYAARFSMRSKGQIHDYATGALLAHEAGAVLIALDGSDYTVHTDTFVACHPMFEAAVRSNLAKLIELNAGAA